MPCPSGTWPTPRRAIASGDRPTSCWSPSNTEPLRGLTSPEMVLTSVVLPAPFAPSTAVMLPSGTDSVTRSSATTPPYATVRSVISSMRDLLSEICRGDIAVRANLRGWAGCDHLAEVEHRDGVAHRHDHVDVMLDERDRRLLTKHAKEGDQVVDVRRGEPACGLVEEQQRRAGHEGPSDDHALLDAVRQHARIHPGAVGNAELGETCHRLVTQGPGAAVG